VRLVECAETDVHDPGPMIFAPIGWPHHRVGQVFRGRQARCQAALILGFNAAIMPRSSASPLSRPMDG
jgi:hypothetical protein